MNAPRTFLFVKRLYNIYIVVAIWRQKFTLCSSEILKLNIYFVLYKSFQSNSSEKQVLQSKLIMDYQ